MRKSFALLLFIVISFCSLNSFAVQTSRPLPLDPRIKIITYVPDAVYNYLGFYNYQASILFGEGEKILTISMGKPDSWYLKPADNRLFLKPLEENATTNMFIITDKHTYHFILEAKDAGGEGINAPDMVFETKFVYSDTLPTELSKYQDNSGPDLSDEESIKNFNFNYTISGSEIIAPIRIFDDGKFTYFQFPMEASKLPAFFIVYSNGKEGLVNYRIQGSYVVVEQTGSQFTLRDGNNVTCVFNESMPFPKELIDKSQN